MTTLMFPGQGSQQIGMGEELFDEFSEYTLKADRILGYSIKELCLKNENSKLDNTMYTQPAIYVVNALSYLKWIKENNRKPDYVVGHSLGEYNALFASGVIDFETGLELVKRRGELMSSVKGGGMLAVVGLVQGEIEEMLLKNGFNKLHTANLNGKKQIVISGLKEDIEKAKSFFEKEPKVIYLAILKVSGAFHSPYMSGIKKEFDMYLNSTSLGKIDIPIISNFTAREYKDEELRETLSNQIDHSVKWTESIQYLMGKGENEFIEVGNGNVLRKLYERIKRELKPLVIDDKESVITSGENLKNKMDIKSDNKEFKWSAQSFGNSTFKKMFNLKYAYVLGGMYKGISSKELVVRAAKSGMLAFLGAGGLSLSKIREVILEIKKEIGTSEFGVNFIHNFLNEDREEDLTDLLLELGVNNIEASGFMSITPALVKYYAYGIKRSYSGKVIFNNKIIAKISRPEVAEAFLSPAPSRIVDKLLYANKITREQADILRVVPMSNAICVEADSAGHTDGGVAYTLVPSIMRLKDEVVKKYNYSQEIPVGTAGGIGTPEAALAAFILGADFILTGSINQCTVEARTSDKVKDLLEKINVQDTCYAPAGDLFELGSEIQVLRRGVFFSARAKKLYDIYSKYDSLDEVDGRTKKQIEEKYFKRSIDEVYSLVREHYTEKEIRRAEVMPKYKMALIFKWYFAYSSNIAINGKEDLVVDYQVQCGPALGAFNQWVKGGSLEHWENRHVDEIGVMVLEEAARLFRDKFEMYNSI